MKENNIERNKTLPFNSQNRRSESNRFRQEHPWRLDRYARDRENYPTTSYHEKGRYYKDRPLDRSESSRHGRDSSNGGQPWVKNYYPQHYQGKFQSRQFRETQGFVYENRPRGSNYYDDKVVSECNQRQPGPSFERERSSSPKRGRYDRNELLRNSQYSSERVSPQAERRVPNSIHASTSPAALAPRPHLPPYPPMASTQINPNSIPASTSSPAPAPPPPLPPFPPSPPPPPPPAPPSHLLTASTQIDPNSNQLPMGPAAFAVPPPASTHCQIDLNSNHFPMGPAAHHVPPPASTQIDPNSNQLPMGPAAFAVPPPASTQIKSNPIQASTSLPVLPPHHPLPHSPTASTRIDPSSIQASTNSAVLPSQTTSTQLNANDPEEPKSEHSRKLVSKSTSKPKTSSKSTSSKQSQHDTTADNEFIEVILNHLRDLTPIQKERMKTKILTCILISKK